MPLHKIEQNGKVCWRWGQHGKVYCGKDGKQAAIKQGIAIEGPERFKQMMEKDNG